MFYKYGIDIDRNYKWDNYKLNLIRKLPGWVMQAKCVLDSKEDG